MKRRMPFFLVFTISLLLFSILWRIGLEAAVDPALAQPVEDATQPEPLVPSTTNDFIMPGSQPETMIVGIADPASCTNCHANYLTPPEQKLEERTWHAWQGSMMAQSGRDPLFFAALDVANAGAANVGEYCLRCHMPRGWLEGRSSAPDASEMTAQDQEGVQCVVCHRLVDPEPDPANPLRDSQILADLELPVSKIGSGQMIMDPEDYRRGPFDILADLGLSPDEDPHRFGGGTTLVSPYHQESELCGTCHDINNPMFTWNEASQSYEPNSLDTPGDITQGFPIERTYSEWRLSEYNSPQGVYAPQFGGNKSNVSTCQDCHMRDITGTGGAFFGGNGLVREDMPLHDLTGANTWVPQIIPLHPEFEELFPRGSERAQALASGVERARYMLQNAARLEANQVGDELEVTIFNESGHKLPTGYVEGRRMWLQVEGFDADCQQVYSSGAYDSSTATLAGYGSDPSLKVYESKQGLTESWAAALGLPAGPSFHFALNNMIDSDNRIPPRGYSFAAFNAQKAAPYTNGVPDAARYADGQYWDSTVYVLPQEVSWGNVRLLYQTASREYIEFLRDNNPYEGPNNGQILYELWEQSGRSRPEVMVTASFGSGRCDLFLPAVQRP